VFDDIALYSPFRTMTLTGGELPERVGVGLATANLFGLLGFRQSLAVTLSPTKINRRARAARHERILETPLRFGSRRARKTLALDGETYKIIGVAPPTVGLGTVDVWVPIGLFERTESFTRGNHPGLIGVGRLKPGVTVAQMNADLTRVSAEIRAEYPGTSGIGAGRFLWRASRPQHSSGARDAELGGVLRLADRMRERRQFAARAFVIASQGDCASRCGRCKRLADSSAAAH
jgi:hypothetical protein